MGDATVDVSDTRPNKNVILFKSETETDGAPDPYVLQLSKISMSATVLPVLSFEYHNLELLKEKLDSPQFYSGVIFSSPRCVEAASKCGPLTSGWKELKNYSVGKKTSSLVQRLLGLESSGDSSGDATNLAEFIAKGSVGKLPLLIPQGNLSLEILPRTLKEKGIATDCVEVYRTLPNPSMPRLLDSYFKQNFPHCIVYFSPSGVNHTIKLLETYVPSLEQVKFVAIGPTTQQHLTQLGVKVLCTADKPTPEHLALALTNSDL